MSNLVIALFDTVAFAGVLMLMYVIRQALNDLHLKRTDRPRVLQARKITFFADAVYVLLTVYFQDYWLAHPTVVVTGLVVTGHLLGGMSLLAVSLISMKERAPINPGHGYRPLAEFNAWRHRYSLWGK